jgi:hypothetical protein
MSSSKKGKFPLVPKLRLGNALVARLRLASHDRHLIRDDSWRLLRSRASRECVPKRELGNEEKLQSSTNIIPSVGLRLRGLPEKDNSQNQRSTEGTVPPWRLLAMSSVHRICALDVCQPSHAFSAMV